jgi:hypothetical protein
MQDAARTLRVLQIDRVAQRLQLRAAVQAQADKLANVVAHTGRLALAQEGKRPAP